MQRAAQASRPVPLFQQHDALPEQVCEPQLTVLRLFMQVLPRQRVPGRRQGCPPTQLSLVLQGLCPCGPMGLQVEAEKEPGTHSSFPQQTWPAGQFDEVPAQ